RHRAGGLLLAARAAGDDGLARGRHRLAVRGRRVGDHPHASPPARRARSRRRGGNVARRQRRPCEVARRRCSHDRDRACRPGRGGDRLRRDHRAAHDPLTRRRKLPAAAAAVGDRRRWFSGLRRRDRPHGAGAAGASDRRRDGLLRGPLLRARAAQLPADGVTALALDRVSVSLGGARILDGLSYQVEPGEWVALIGPNGAGKTTALRAVAGLVPYEGRLRVFNHDAGTIARKQLARQVALVPQVPLIPGDITVREYVLLGRTPHLGYFGSEGRVDQRAADSALEQLDLVPFARRRLETLSGGERQRATLARALAQ